jgi:hypothetical protein
MKILKSIFMVSLSLVLGAVVFSSCNVSSNENGNGNNNTLYTFATVAAVGDTGATFTFRKEDDSPLITLTSTQSFNKDTVKVGMRVFIAYTIESNQAYTSGPVTITGMLSPFGGDILAGYAKDYSQFASQQIKLDAMWRSGEYLNVTATAPYYQNPKTFKLVVDSTTIDDTYPKAYLIFESDREIDLVSDKAVYGSFDLSPVWNLETFKGLEVTVNNSGTLRTYTFTKGTQIITPMD